MPDITGFEVIAKLKGKNETKNIPVIFVTGLTQKSNEEQGLLLGAADYIHKPFNAAIVKLRVQNQIQIVNQLQIIHHLSMTDALTDTANRRHFNIRLNQEWQRARRDNTNISLLLLDIDDFKQTNDEYGHVFGDAVLQSVAHNIKTCLKRSTDLAARWGGEEFAVLLPNTPLEGANIVAENIRTAIEDHEYPSSELKGLSTTISIGTNSIIPSQDISLTDFISDTDKALYRAKKLGKNRVCTLPFL